MADIARIGGWSLEYILWSLPFGGGLGLLHADGIFHGAVLRRVGAQRDGMAGMRDAFLAMREGRADGGAG